MLPEGAAVTPLAVRIARQLSGLRFEGLDTRTREKVKLCLLDLIGCACEARELPWSRQAVAVAERGAGARATIIGEAQPASGVDAAFANGAMGHGLVREDMHAGAVSHLGVAVLPALMALSQGERVHGRDFVLAAVAGYEVGARIGRSVMDTALASTRRPTGITGPIGGAAAGARMLRLPADAIASAMAFAANATGGLNEWAHTGGSEMFFHPGFAARNAVTAVRLAQAGAFGSPTGLDGPGGLFASLGKPAAGDGWRMFDGEPEILSVYHKPVPACNFAQSASLAALGVAQDSGMREIDRIASVLIEVPRAGALYPGCDSVGPFDHVLQAKMSIQYNVAAALIERALSERNFALLRDPRLHRLLSRTELRIDDDMTRSYPARQGGAVTVLLDDGRRIQHRLDDVVNATPEEIRARFRKASEAALGAARSRQVEEGLEALEHNDDAGSWVALLGGDPETG